MTRYVELHIREVLDKRFDQLSELCGDVPMSEGPANATVAALDREMVGMIVFRHKIKSASHDMWGKSKKRGDIPVDLIKL
jgi:hypothetical protein